MLRQDIVLAPSRDQQAIALRSARRTGILQLVNKNLIEIPTAVYSLEDHLDKDEKRWECIDLMKIDLSHNEISTIAKDIQRLTTVTYVKMAHNVITSLPTDFFQLSSLTYLDLSHNQLSGAISEEMGNLINLRECHLSANQLHALPTTLGKLTHLEILHAEENQLECLPESIGQLNTLHTLIAHTNNLYTLPNTLSSLCLLQTLDLKKNKLTHLPGDIFKPLNNLIYLDLRQNSIQVVPSLPQPGHKLDQVLLGFNRIDQFPAGNFSNSFNNNITVLDLRDNKLVSIPAEIACLKNIKTLDLANNNLSDLPPALGYLSNLQHLTISGNPLKSIRSGVRTATCEVLKKFLRLRGPPIDTKVVSFSEQYGTEANEWYPQQEQQESENKMQDHLSNDILRTAREAACTGTFELIDMKLQTLPNSWLNYDAFKTTLRELNISKNELAELPTAIGGLCSLEKLICEHNCLQTIGSSVATLPKLKYLGLRHNLLKSDNLQRIFSSELCTLPKTLKELDLRNCQLTYIPPAFSSLLALETLLLSFNSIELLDFKYFEWSKLSALTYCNLSDNKIRSITSLSTQSSFPPRLKSLSLNNNNLKSIPSELSLCPNLRIISINGNPQRTVRGAIIAQGSETILKYLRSKLPLNSYDCPDNNQIL